MLSIHVQFWPAVIAGLVVLATGIVAYAILGIGKDVHMYEEGEFDEKDIYTPLKKVK